MQIDVSRLTEFDLLTDAVEFVFGTEIGTSVRNMSRWYASGHSPIRTQLYAIYAVDTPYSVCMQMRTHDKNGALFLVEPGRPDTGTERAKHQEGNYRDQPRNMFILCNAQHLLDWSHKRLCMKAEEPTREWFKMLRHQIAVVDPVLASHMVPMCEYRGGICGEFKPCGKGRKLRYGSGQNN